jgi:stage V sporulation protein G
LDRRIQPTRSRTRRGGGLTTPGFRGVLDTLAEGGTALEITEIRITLRDDDKLRAFASITLEDSLVIRGLKVIEGANGMFVAMPSRQRKDGSYQDVAHPINRETREWLERMVIGAYQEEVARLEQEEPSVMDDGSGDLAAEDAY